MLVFSVLPLFSFCSIWGLLLIEPALAASPIQVSFPSKPSTGNAVKSNFLGISFELSFMDEYFGNDTSSIPRAVVNYISALRSRTDDNPLRFRIGGNSMDSSNYLPTLQSPMMQHQPADGSFNSNNQPVNYGPMLWDVMNKVSNNVGGIIFLIGLSLLDPNNSNVVVLAGAAQQALGDSLDAFIVGNEPDLYSKHGNRPNLKNYTVQNYIDEFRVVTNHLTNTSAGNILQRRNIAGPTICCFWNLDTLLTEGYLAAFGDVLKYITLQHYPQNDCSPGDYPYGISYYIQHVNAVKLAQWQRSGATALDSISPATRPKLIMDEFSSASCGGIPGLSDTFAVGSMWTVDYALQLASSGYSAAYLHTRERGISYNLVTPPDVQSAGPGTWTTNPTYYALLAAAEALHSEDDGILVVDLNINNSVSDARATVSGYALYSPNSFDLQQLVLFNYANSSSQNVTFAIPAAAVTSSISKSNATVKYLSAASLEEKTLISWAGQTLSGVGNGVLVSSPNVETWAIPNAQLDCSNGCTIPVPPFAMAVAFFGTVPDIKIRNSGHPSTPLLSTGNLLVPVLLRVFLFLL